MASRRAAANATISTNPPSAVDRTVGAASPSPEVRTILRIEARASRLLARYERALATATRAKGEAHVLLDQADGLERALSGTQLGELRQARAHAVAITTIPNPTTPDLTDATTSTDGGPA